MTRKPSRFDLEIKRLTAKAVEESLATIALILETKYRVRLPATPAPQGE